MDAAKSSIKKILSRDGKHDTTVHETINPAVQNETVTQSRHEETTAALDREVHQDHYHTSEQPINDSQVLPEQHHHNLAAVEHKSFEHDDAEAVKRRLADEQSRYRDSSRTVEGESTSSVAPTVAGEHVHHHVYENIQPVINKQTVEPHVVHTTVPIHEVHHNQAQHHSASALPALSMDEFKSQGGALGGREERHDQFAGEPRMPHLRGDHHHTGSGIGRTGNDADRVGGGSGIGGVGNDADRVGGGGGIGGVGNDTARGVGGGTVGVGNDTGRGVGGRGIDGYDSQSKQSNYDSADVGRGQNTGNTTSTGKPSLMDKLNPSVDSNGDGKKGFMK